MTSKTHCCDPTRRISAVSNLNSIVVVNISQFKCIGRVTCGIQSQFRCFINILYMISKLIPYRKVTVLYIVYTDVPFVPTGVSICYIRDLTSI